MMSSEQTDGEAAPAAVALERIPNRVGFVIQPLIWVGDKWIYRSGSDDCLVQRYKEVVITRTLANGTTVQVERDGFCWYNFTNAGEQYAGFTAEGVPDYERMARIRAHRFRFINAHLVCLYTAMNRAGMSTWQKMTVGPNELFYISANGSSSVRGTLPDIYHLVRERFPFPDYVVQVLEHARFGITHAVFDDSLTLLDQMIGHESNDVIQAADLLLRATTAVEEGDYQLALNLTWVMIERMIETEWERFKKDNEYRQIGDEKVQFINARRKSILANIHIYSASTQLEILSIAGELPFDLYTALSKLRKARNDWIHGLAPVPLETAMLSTDTFQKMLRRVHGIELIVIPAPIL